MSDTVTDETLPLDQVLTDAVEAILLDTHTAMPGKITRVISSQYVDVQPLFQREYLDGTVETLPIAQNVPVQLMAGKDWWIKPPLAVGDIGTLLFQERSMDRFVASSGEVVNPKQLQVPMPANPTDLVVHNGKAELCLQKAGTFRVTNGSQELFALLDSVLQNFIQTLQILQQAQTPTLGGPRTFLPNYLQQFQQLQQTVTDLQKNLESLKGS